MRLTEEQVVERLEGSGALLCNCRLCHQLRRSGALREMPDTLALVGVRWTGDHYEEAPDGE